MSQNYPITSILQLFQSFIQGPRQIDGQDLLNLVNLVFSSQTGVVAAVNGGVQAGAPTLTGALCRVDTSTNSGTDAVLLPQAVQGRNVAVWNNTGNTITVLGQPTNAITGVGDTIVPNSSNTPAATGTGITMATAKVGEFYCFTNGVWKLLLSN